jgi:hypothetical protein
LENRQDGIERNPEALAYPGIRVEWENAQNGIERNPEALVYPGI